MRDFSYFPCVTKPTRVQNNRASLIDHIWVNFDNQKEYISNIIFSGVSDHFPITFHLDSSLSIKDKTRVTFR